MNNPKFEREHNDFGFAWADIGISFTVENVRDGRDGPVGEITIRTTDPLAPHVLGPVFVNLFSARDRWSLGQRLQERSSDGLNWYAYVETVFAVTAREFRRGEPAINLATVSCGSGGVPQCLSWGIPQGETTILYGDGGSLKSTLAVAACVSLLTGVTLIPHWRPTWKLPAVLYLDWETGAESVGAAGRAMAEAAGVDFPTEGFHYIPMTRPFAEEARRIREDVTRLGVQFLVLDSLSFAAGIEPDSNGSATAVMNALRSLGPDVTRLAIGHVAKASLREGGRQRTKGAVSYENGARSVWEIRRDDDASPGLTRVGLYHRKTNRGRRQQPFALEVEFGEDELPGRIRAVDIRADEQLAGPMPLGQRILLALRQSCEPIPVFRLAELVEADAVKVQRELDRMPSAVVRLERDWSDREQRAHTVWALRASGEAV